MKRDTILKDGLDGRIKDTDLGKSSDASGWLKDIIVKYVD